MAKPRRSRPLTEANLLLKLAEALDLGGQLQREMERPSRIHEFVGPGNLLDTSPRS